MSNENASYKLSDKFGVDEDAAPALLAKARRYADELGVSFHVGSQCMAPSAYRDAMELASGVILRAGVTIDVVDVGGGFPSAYPGMSPPDLTHYMRVIKEAFEDMPVLMNADLWCEPGRALVNESTPSHCGFTLAEGVGGWEALRAWIAGARQPGVSDLQTGCNAALAAGAGGPCRYDASIKLPTFEVAGMTLTKRLTLILRDGVVEHVFYPVFPPDRNGGDVLAWLAGKN